MSKEDDGEMLGTYEKLEYILEKIEILGAEVKKIKCWLMCFFSSSCCCCCCELMRYHCYKVMNFSFGNWFEYVTMSFG